MPVTRINNNQITDSSAGNVYLGVNAAAKVQDFSVTGGKLQNNLTYGSDFTITGNLTVQGNTTTIDTVNLVVEDPLILLAKEQTGSPTLDIGYIGKRGTSDNIAFVWDESADEFVTAFTTSENTNTVITISSYASLKTLDMAVTGNLAVTGNTSFTGNISSLAVTGNIDGGNLRTPGLVTATGNVTGGNINTSGNVSVTGNVNGTGAVFSGNVSAQNFIGNISGNIDAGGANTNVQFNDGDLLNGSANFTFNKATNVMSVTGTIEGTTVSATGTVNGAYVYSSGELSAAGNVVTANVFTSGQASATGNVTGGNILTGGRVSATGNVSGGNLTTAGLVSATGNMAGNNISAAGFVSATGNVNGAAVNTATLASTGGITIQTGSNGDINIQPNGTGNIVLSNTYINSVRYPVQDQDAASKIYVDNLVSTAISYHDAVVVATTANLATTTGGTITYNQPNGAGNGIGATITTTGSFNLIDTANVQTIGTRILVKDEGNAALNGVYVWSNATAITRSTDTNTYGAGNVDALGLNDYFFVQSGNVNKGSAWIVDAPTGTITFGTSLIQFAQFSQSQTYTANTAAGIILNGTVFSAKVDNNTTAFDVGGNIIVKAGANLTTPNIGAATGTSLSVTGNVTGGNLNTGGVVSATGNVTGGNITTSGNVDATSAFVNAGAVLASGRVEAGTTMSAGGNITSAGNVVATANVIGGNLSTAGVVTATGNVIGGNLVTGGLATVTGNVIGGNVSTAGLVTATGNVTGGNILTGGVVSATGNINTSANVVATANVIGGNLSTAGLITATGNIIGANLILTSGTIDGPAAGRITINGSDLDTDFAVDGDTVPNIFYVDAGTGTASFGSSAQTTNAIVAFNATNSILMPVGNTLQRPGTGVLGMLRFNSTGDSLEVYTSGGWEDVGVPAFTVVTSDQFNGNGVQTVFTLSQPATTASTIVSINGVVQIPTTAYSVAGNALTFTEAPALTDVIDARLLTTTTTVTAIENTSGNAIVEVLDTADTVQITGNLLPLANVTYDLGSNTRMWKNGYFAGNTIYLGNLQLKEASANTFAVFTSDGVTQANVDVGNIDVSSIVSGTSTIGISGTNGNAYITVGGTANVLVVSTNRATVTGAISATGNITGDYILGNGSQLTGIDATSIQFGSSNVRVVSSGGNVSVGVGGTSNVAVFDPLGLITYGRFISTGNTAAGNLRTTGEVSATGNVIGGNVTTVGLISATGNITGNYIFGNGSQLTGIDATSIQFGTSNVRVQSSGGNVSVGVGGSAIVRFTTDGIVNDMGNGVGNIGNSTNYFNTVFAKATSAQYADLAEMYEADGLIEPGTVVAFGGAKEVTTCGEDSSRRVAGVVSTNPSYIMNAGLAGDNVVAVALTGRVPTKVTGTVRKGDMLVAAGSGRARAEANPQVGAVIGKALADFDGAEGTIEVVVGRL